MPTNAAPTPTPAAAAPIDSRRIASHVVSPAVSPATRASAALAAHHPPRRIGSARTTGSNGSWGETWRPDASSGIVCTSRSISWYGR